MALAGSTATELGLIGALVLVATLGLWFLLGDGLKQAFGLVKSDMLAQVSNAKANSMTVEPSEPLNEPPSSTSGDPVIEPADPAPTVVTAGSNGNEAHAEIYNALQALIDRSMQKGTMTEAQADVLTRIVKQIILNNELITTIRKAEETTRYNRFLLAEMKVEFRGQTVLLKDLAKRLGKTLNFSPEFEGYGFLVDPEATDETTEHGVLKKLYAEAEGIGLLEDREILDFIEEVVWSVYNTETVG